tara:strand:+ start:851 stop:1165 length:315 start_codon:yes stop_codon:yes gene_type:complete
MSEIKKIVPTAINSIGIVTLLVFSLKKFKDFEDKITELERKIQNQKKPLPVDNSEIIEKLNKKIEQMIPMKLEQQNKPIEKVVQDISTSTGEDDVDMAISELLA